MLYRFSAVFGTFLVGFALAGCVSASSGENADAGAGANGETVGGAATTLAACSGDGLYEGAKAHCDDSYLYIESTGVPDHDVMVGITHWNAQYVVPQAYTGTNAFRIPLHPVVTSTPTSTQVGPLGVAVNGVPIFNPYAQDGKTDAVLDGEMDVCGGHAGRADDYHYHAAPTCLMDELPPGNPVGFAFDGFPIYGFADPDGTLPSNVDECNGHTDAKGEYHYNTIKKAPYLLGCFHGAFDQNLVPGTTPSRPAGEPTPGEITAYYEDSQGCLHVVLNGTTDVPYCPPKT